MVMKRKNEPKFQIASREKAVYRVFLCDLYDGTIGNHDYAITIYLSDGNVLVWTNATSHNRGSNEQLDIVKLGVMLYDYTTDKWEWKFFEQGALHGFLVNNLDIPVKGVK